MLCFLGFFEHLFYAKYLGAWHTVNTLVSFPTPLQPLGALNDLLSLVSKWRDCFLPNKHGAAGVSSKGFLSEEVRRQLCSRSDLAD